LIFLFNSINIDKWIDFDFDFDFDFDRQHYSREIVSFSPDFGTVNFYEKRTYVFDPINTIGSLDDNITVINVPFAVSLDYH